MYLQDTYFKNKNKLMEKTIKKQENISKLAKIELAINEISTNEKYEANRLELIKFFELKLIKLQTK